MAIGHSKGAYGTINRSPNYMGEALSQNADLKYRYDVLNEGRAVKKEKAKQDELDKVAIPDLKNIATLNSNLEKAKAKAALETRQSFLDAQNAINNAKTTEEKQLAYAKANNAKNTFDNLNSFSTQILDKTKYLTDNFDKLDELSSSKAMQKLLMAGKGYGDIEQQEDGQVMFTPLDEKGNPLGDKQTLAGFLASIEDEVLKKSTFSEELVKSVNSVGKLTKVDDLGNQTIEDIGVTPENKEVSKNAFIKSFLGDDSNRRIYARDNNIKENDTEAIVKSVSDLYDSKFDETHKKTFNTAIMNYKAGRDDEAYQRWKDAQEKAEKDAKENEKKPNIQEPSIVTKAGTKDKVNLQKGARDFPITNAIIKNAGGTESKATNVYVNSGGKMYLRIEKHGVGSQTEKNGTTSTTSKLIEVQMLDFGKDGDQIGRYAQKLGYSGANDFKEDMIARSGGDKFITTPNERKPKGTPQSKGKTTTTKKYVVKTNKVSR